LKVPVEDLTDPRKPGDYEEIPEEEKPAHPVRRPRVTKDGVPRSIMPPGMRGVFKPGGAEEQRMA
jgi:hypothetical protein